MCTTGSGARLGVYVLHAGVVSTLVRISVEGLFSGASSNDLQECNR